MLNKEFHSGFPIINCNFVGISYEKSVIYWK